MTKQEALDWLNYRLQLESTMGRNNHFTSTDFNFFQYFIKHRTSKEVYINDLMYSIIHYSESCLSWVERLINHLVYTYKIEIEVDRVNIFLNISSGFPEDARKIIKYK